MRGEKMARSTEYLIGGILCLIIAIVAYSCSIEFQPVHLLE